MKSTTTWAEAAGAAAAAACAAQREKTRAEQCQAEADARVIAAERSTWWDALLAEARSVAAAFGKTAGETPTGFHPPPNFLPVKTGAGNVVAFPPRRTRV